MVNCQIKYGTSSIDFTLEYSERKTLGIKVHPDKSVQVTAPLGSSIETIKEKIRNKASWILKQQDFFLSFHPKTPTRKYISGETHLYLGKQYRLKVEEANEESVKLHGGNIEIAVKSKKNKKHIEKLLQNWYKKRALSHFEKLFKECVPLTRGFYNGTPSLNYRWMKKRWGSCDKEGRIHLNLELIKAPKKCIEYVIVHELCHLAHLNHSNEFYNLLEKKYPDWRATKDRLEKLMV